MNFVANRAQQPPFLASSCHHIGERERERALLKSRMVPRTNKINRSGGASGARARELTNNKADSPIHHHRDIMHRVRAPGSVCGAHGETRSCRRECRRSIESVESESSDRALAVVAIRRFCCARYFIANNTRLIVKVGCKCIRYYGIRV